MTGRHAAPRDWWPALLAAGVTGVAAGIWLTAAWPVPGTACYAAGAWLTAAWIGHDLTARLPRRRR